MQGDGRLLYLGSAKGSLCGTNHDSPYSSVLGRIAFDINRQPNMVSKYCLYTQIDLLSQPYLKLRNGFEL